VVLLVGTGFLVYVFRDGLFTKANTASKEETSKTENNNKTTGLGAAKTDEQKSESSNANSATKQDGLSNAAAIAGAEAKLLENRIGISRKDSGLEAVFANQRGNYKICATDLGSNGPEFNCYNEKTDFAISPSNEFHPFPISTSNLPQRFKVIVYDMDSVSPGKKADYCIAYFE
jgi:hypothetical protein